ncbi:hypothetical protein [Candidatus Palauibacter sp.]|uniref:hypothetical protein n=1 Tax=Candidatus Palauibacter sp. TaxID=3101350 RepID=UPI003AF1E64F
MTVDVTGYFSDADGDELSYMASSSNADVATASMEGTTVTIEGVAAGQAVINVTASDGESTVAQGFSVTVEAREKSGEPQAARAATQLCVRFQDTGRPSFEPWNARVAAGASLRFRPAPPGSDDVEPHLLRRITGRYDPAPCITDSRCWNG